MGYNRDRFFSLYQNLSCQLLSVEYISYTHQEALCSGSEALLALPAVTGCVNAQSHRGTRQLGEKVFYTLICQIKFLHRATLSPGPARAFGARRSSSCSCGDKTLATPPTRCLAGQRGRATYPSQPASENICTTSCRFNSH